MIQKQNKRSGGYVTDSKTEVNQIVKALLKGIIGANCDQAALENQVSSWSNQDGGTATTVELPTKYSFSRKTQHLSGGSKCKIIKL